MFEIEVVYWITAVYRGNIFSHVIRITSHVIRILIKIIRYFICWNTYDSVTDKNAGHTSKKIQQILQIVGCLT